MGNGKVLDEDQVNFSDKKAEVLTFDRYRGEKGRIDRLGILSNSLVRAYSHFTENKDFKVIRCLSTKEKREKCCESFGQPQQRFGLVLFKYLTDNEGKLVDVAKCQGKLLLWAVSDTRYEELRALSQQWPLLDTGEAGKQHDLQITCTEDKFQRMNFAPCPEAHWKKRPEWYKALKDKELFALERLKIVLGRRLNEQEVKDLFGPTVKPGGPAPTAGIVDLDDVLNGVADDAGK